MKKTSYLLIILLFFNTAVTEAKPLVLGYPEFAPFTYSNQGGATGIGILRFNEVIKQTPLSITYMPVATYGKGVAWLKEGKIDGLLLATQNAERDAVATFIDLSIANRWIWFSKANKSITTQGDEAKSTLRIVTATNANTHKWLVKSGYRLIETTSDPSTMLRLLMKDRVDAVFLAEFVLLQALEKSRWQKKDLMMTVERTKPFGVYFNNQTLQSDPTLLPTILKAVNQR